METNKKLLGWKIDKEEITIDGIDVLLSAKIVTANSNEPLLQLIVSNKDKTKQYTIDFTYTKQLNFMGYSS
jgi:hypothetical protein